MAAAPICWGVMDQIEAVRDPDNHRLRRRQAPPEHFEPTADIPQPRRATVVRHVNPTGATSGAKS